MNSTTRALSQTDRITNSSARVLLFMLRARATMVLILLMIIFTVLTPDFLRVNNLSILAKQIAILGILAIGMTFSVLTAGIDLSVGAVAGLSGMVSGYVLTQGIGYGGRLHYPDVAVAVVAGLLVALAVGALNGWLVSRALVAPFIATLGTLYIARGAAMLLSGGKTFPDLGGQAARGNTGFPAIGQSFFLHVSIPVWIALALFGVTAIIARRTPFGRHVYAVGGNERASRLAGIRVKRVQFLVYVYSAFCAGIVGLIIASELEAAHPATGENFELNAIAAIVLGGTSLMGGRGTVTGSVLGACVIGVLADGLILMGVSEFWQMVVTGLVIVLAVTVDQMQSRVQSRLLPYLLRSRAEAG